MEYLKRLVVVLSAFLGALPCSNALAKTVEYDLTIAEQEVTITGRPARAMTINGGVPGPTLRFAEGDLARISVHNRMEVATSIHWHGVLVPPGMDGVPLISFPPIDPGATFTYEFPIRQHGTYWYHSHSNLQEQSGVYGSIVIEPPGPQQKTDRDYVVMLSDWTDEDPHQVLRTLKRGSEWFALEKGSAQSIFGAARVDRLGDYFRRELQRMPAMDIADVAYDRFLANGAPEISLAAQPGERVRLRIIDGSATTFFHLEFSGAPLRIISADGQDVEPIEERLLLIGVAETYDVLVTVPESGAWELRATAHDGSGYSSIWLGSGERHPAPDIPLPNLYAGMGRLSLNRIFALTPAGSMGMSDADVASGRFDQPGMMEMNMDMGHGGMGMNMSGMRMDDGSGMKHDMHGMHGMTGMRMGNGSGMMPGMMGMQMDSSPPSPAEQAELEDLFAEPQPGAAQNRQSGPEKMEMLPADQIATRNGKKFTWNFRPLAADISSSHRLVVDGMSAERPWPPYDQLRAVHPTALAPGTPLREIRLTLDGDMERYVWSLNNRTLSESDDILIRQGERVRFIMINRTMMHHPMHLHGHFFRVINGQGDYSPLKHTVDVAPMSTTVIEFEANEVGDWFFHCHLLYHMKSGMARAVHYENYRLTPQLAEIRPQLYRESWYAWGDADLLSNMAEGMLILSGTRYSLSADAEVGWQEVEKTEWETLLLANRYLDRFTSFFVGADLGNAIEDDRGVLGVRYLLPLNLESTSFIGSDGDARVALEKSFQLLPRLDLHALLQYDTDSYWETVAGLSYVLNKTVSLRAQWHSDYGWGAGLQMRF